MKKYAGTLVLVTILALIGLTIAEWVDIYNQWSCSSDVIVLDPLPYPTD